MYIAKILFSITIAFSAVQNIYTAELTPEQRDFAGSVAKTLQEYFSSISSLSFRSTVERWQNDKLASPQSLLGPQKGSFDFVFWKGKFRIDDRMGMGPEGEETRSLMTFDGQTYQRLHYVKGMLYIRTFNPEEPPPAEIFLNYTNFFFQAFEFLSEDLVEDKVNEFKISEFASDDCYKRLIDRILTVELPKAPGDDGIVEFRGGRDRMSGIATTYRVRFSSKNGLLPSGWQRLDAERRPVVDLTIQEFGTVTDQAGQMFAYPKSLVMSGYVKKVVVPVEDGPVFKFNVKIKDFLVNQEPTEDDEFTIDPAQANYIWDGNHSKRIKVPR